MESFAWEGCSLELARLLLEKTPLKLANRRIDKEEKLRFLRYVAGISRNRKICEGCRFCEALCYHAESH